MSSEDSRTLLYNDSKFLKLIILKDFIFNISESTLNTPLNLHKINSLLLFKFFGESSNYSQIKYSNSLYKSQYRPMRKGITNMIKLHADGAVAMPTEIRLHVVTSSKDIIHSWAIPSAGIKIDCIPGFSSHRVTVFLVSGIFWGQCMEICGRFHHWMPIIVYFMRRDLFFLWCSHFMHFSTIDQVFNMTDKQISDRARVISYSTSSWAKDLVNLI